MDLRKGFPVGVLLLKKNALDSCLVFTFHRSATDGLRAVIFMRKVFDNYNNIISKYYKSEQYIRTSSKGDELLKFANNQRSEGILKRISLDLTSR
jgi:hypothetical protein